MSAQELTECRIQQLDGSTMDWKAYQGKVMLFVNVASRCGYTKQYEGLVKLHNSLKNRGLVVIGVPSNDFGGQEPGTAEEITTFCRNTYQVDFPMTEKVTVKGENKHPLYAWLTRGRGEPKWNFHKYLVDKKGQVVAEFPSKTTPDSPELIAAIEAALGAP